MADGGLVLGAGLPALVIQDLEEVVAVDGQEGAVDLADPSGVGKSVKRLHCTFTAEHVLALRILRFTIIAVLSDDAAPVRAVSNLLERFVDLLLHGRQVVRVLVCQDFHRQQRFDRIA